MFDKKKVSKCDNCIIGKNEKKGKIKVLDRGDGSLRRGKYDAEVLIVLSRYETDKFIVMLENYLRKYEIKNYAIISGLDCSIKDIKGYTQYELYKYCDTVNLDKFENLKVVLTIGAGLFAITKTNDINNWREFKEFVFNQTYFYTGFNQDRVLRVYPLPYLDEIKDFDSFERYFTERQLEFIVNYLNE